MPSIWIFGYGSLVHRPGFEHARKVQGYITDYKRVWHQGSTDHRGTPEKPGRVVTLEPSPGAVTWGVAYELPGSEKHQLETLRYLEWREKQYDVRHLVDVYGIPETLPETDLAQRNEELSQATLPEAASSPNLETAEQAATHNNHGALTNALSCPSLTSTTDASGKAPKQSSTNGSNTKHQVVSQQVDVEVSVTVSNSENQSTTVTQQTTIPTDPLMSSDEVLQFAPPSDWQQLSADVFVNKPPGQAPAGPVPGTQLMLRHCLCYVASSDIKRNVNYLGPAELDAVATQIAHAHGPSGANWEYLVKLAAAMRQMGVEDFELFELESKVLALRASLTDSKTGLEADVVATAKTSTTISVQP